MQITDLVQVLILSVMLLTLIVILFQLRIQNDALTAQTYRDRFDLYWQTYEPTSLEELEDVRAFPQEYMDITLYNEVYAQDERKLRRYLCCLALYEYLAFSHALKKLKIRDPIGPRWTEQWTDDLLQETEFGDVHNYIGRYWPDFAEFVETRKEASLPFRRPLPTLTRQ